MKNKQKDIDGFTKAYGESEIVNESVAIIMEWLYRRLQEKVINGKIEWPIVKSALEYQLMKCYGNEK